MLRTLAVCLATAVLTLSAACSSTNVSSDMSPSRDASITPLGGGTGGDDAMITPGLPGTGGDDAMKVTSVTPLGGGTGGDDAMNTPPPPTTP
jgi:hypothetical protein